MLRFWSENVLSLNIPEDLYIISLMKTEVQTHFVHQQQKSVWLWNVKNAKFVLVVNRSSSAVKL